MKTIRQTYKINARVEDVWRALVDPVSIDEWGGGPCRMDDRAGTKFELWGGDIHGVNREVVPPRRLVQDWYSGDWPQPSRVTFSLSRENGQTRADLLHEDVPDGEYDEIAEGWKDFYLGPIKEYLEFQVD